MKMTLIGATHEVTGSCIFLDICGRKILIDFGMQQGQDTYENARIPCAPAGIDYVILTHAHIDHSGLLPLLYAGGFSGEIHASSATVSLCEIMLRDSAHIQEFEAEWHNRKARRRGEAARAPLYTMEEAEETLTHFVRHPYYEKITLFDGVVIRFLDAGHLLGSSSIEMWITEGDITRKIVFSGDIGNKNQPLICDPTPPDSADLLVMESTYGSRLHEKPKGYLPGFIRVIQETFSRGGSVIIPCFAVGRTQEILYYLKKIKDSGLLSEFGDFPIYMDSPLALAATQVFLQNRDSCFDAEAKEMLERGENPIGVSGLICATTSDESKAINDDPRRKIILSASGMCEAGRIKHHLKHNLWKPENTVLFVGYQAEGTLGRQLLDGAKRVTLFGETVEVLAEIVELPGMSGHADQNGLCDWLSHVKGVREIFLVHGATDSMEALAERIRRDFSIDVHAPYSGSVVDLATGAIIYDAPPQPIPQKVRNDSAYQRLVTVGKRLTQLIQNSRGLANRELSKMADSLAEWIDMWERKDE